ncbi:hypothetical protein TVAG_392080 [Trichomonas vaginalis G3]|uniref:Uncharacterized protein n=1 Tax=Trichomonas vaginalis (strain ATCC PRA-98 / G3) TaxID=412133 RepID=A2DWQ9_TRIV3|nr:regulation of choline O-acetyltransferase protein [Trichomonas vaginalis G3]EAY15091.1 hypothetical protein TVAG_392080 [Trichomonas vaginalis G3]KAI5499227.1 regulation of choline O-acetyltransferase protein [Trichomonas vaginalis G3]|eukprot:XP_001327314.1 hypothetical protein [Trichomonas vaginalis G3]
MTAEQIQAYQQTIENTRVYLERILRVKPLPDRYIGYSDEFSAAMRNLTVIATNCDLYIVWMVHPSDSDDDLFQVADISYWDTTYWAYHQMTVIFNPRKIPTQASQINTRNDNFFNNLMSAILVGIQTRGHFHAKLSSNYYPNPYCFFTKNEIQYAVLTTPYAHHHGKHFFGQEWFVGDDNTCPSGVLLYPDSLRPHTAFYPEDMLVPLNLQHDGVPFLRFTEVTMANLLDSGNFEVDWRFGKPLIFGNKEYINGEYMPNWPLGPAYTTLPWYYFENPNVSLDESSFTFKSWGIASSYNGDCSDPNIASYFTEYCNAQSYYNPYGYQKFGSKYINYYLLKGQRHYCDDGTATIPGMTYYDEDECAVYNCADDYQSFTINVVTDQVAHEYLSINCSADGQQYSYIKNYAVGAQLTRTVVCPPPEAFCRTVEGYDEWYPSNPFQNVLFPTPTPFATPRITPKVTPIMTPAYTPKNTPVKTPYSTAKTTPFITPFKTQHTTPFVTVFSTPVFTHKTTPINTPFKTQFMTPHSTPHSTAAYTPKYMAKQTPFKTAHLTPKLTHFNTPKLTPHSTPHSTAQVTPHITPFYTPIATYAESASRKVYRKHKPGTYMGFAYFCQEV